MPITELNHYFVRANDLEKTKDFYVDVLGFHVMERPRFPFHGYWLGVNGVAQIHMGPHDLPNAQLYYLGSPRNAATDQTGVIDHIAFLATEPDTFKRRFRELNIAFRPRYQPEVALYQLFIKDPNGITIELNFAGFSGDPDWGGEDYTQMPKA